MVKVKLNPKFETVSVKVFVGGHYRTCYMIVDRATKIPFFPASVFLLHEYSRGAKGYKQLADRIRYFLDFCDAVGKDPLKADTADVEAYLDKYLFKEKKLSASTVMQYGMPLEIFFEAMKEMGFVSHALKIPKNFRNSALQEKKNLYLGSRNSLDPFGIYRRYLDEDDFDSITSYVPSKNKQLKRRDELMLKVAYKTGCRASEIVSGDNFSQRRLRKELKTAVSLNRTTFLYDIIGKGRGVGKPRKISIPVDLAREIVSYLNEFSITSDIIFCTRNGTQLNDGECTRLFKRCKDALLADSNARGIENFDLWVQHKETRTFHSLRHSYATNLAHFLRTVDGPLHNDFDYLRNRMGHSDFNTTKVYINFEMNLHGSSTEQADLLLKDLPAFTSEIAEELED